MSAAVTSATGRSATAAVDEPPPTGPSRRRQVVRVAAAACLVLGAVHVAVVAPLYHVGSFDDDSHYVLLARALAGGHGFVDLSTPGTPLESTVPPGYPALLTPLALLWSASWIPMRALSAACYLALFPLTWRYLGLRLMPDGARLAVLALLALNPVAATYGSMVMAETPFLVVLLIGLLAMHRWDRQDKALTGTGLGVVAALLGLVYLKSAGLAMVAGVVIYLLGRRRWRQAALAGFATAAGYLPLVIIRVQAGGSLLGARYAGELSTYYQASSPVSLLQTVPQALLTYLRSALPDTIVPTQLPSYAAVSGGLDVVRFTVAPLCVVGAVVWWRRSRDVGLVLAAAYLVETLAYPFVNERRVILVLPLVLAWYVVGLATTGRLVLRAVDRRPRWRARAPAALAMAATVLIVAPLAAQLHRDYLLPVGRHTAQLAGAPYFQLLRDAGPSSVPVAASYQYSTALFGGHPVTRTPFDAPCDETAVRGLVSSARIGFLLTGDFRPDQLLAGVDSPCLLEMLDESPDWAVRLYRTPRQDVSVFELVGPGTAHPNLRDLVAGQPITAGGDPLALLPEPTQVPDEPAGDYVLVGASGSAELTATFAGPGAVSQVSLGAAGRLTGAAGRIDIALRRPDGSWLSVAATTGNVGPSGRAPYLLVRPGGVEATAVRVSLTGGGPFELHDLHVLGVPGGGGP